MRHPFTIVGKVDLVLCIQVKKEKAAHDTKSS